MDTCKSGMVCIEEYADSAGRGMEYFYEALGKVSSLDRPVRIAYFGDSFIEADILTGDLREMLQKRFGGCGVGYVPITTKIAGFRPTVHHSFGGWGSHPVSALRYTIRLVDGAVTPLRIPPILTVPVRTFPIIILFLLRELMLA